MITFIVSFILGFMLFSVLLKAPPPSKFEPMKPSCPPHKWSYQKVLNEDGSTHHEHLVCAKCGPLRGESDGR